MAEANGNTPHTDGAAVEEPLVEPQLAAEPEEPVRIPKGLYFVRVPRPEFDESTIKHLQEEVSKQITKLKAINGKTQVKRGEANAIRQQLQDARTIRDGSKPDYETKMGRIKELQEMRKSYLDRISDIRSGQKGLEVRSEEDLDAKIAGLEEEIASGSIDLRAEKQVVAQIAKLRGQRDKVREFQAAQGDLGQLEADLKRVKAMLAEQQDEFKIITGERDQVKVIITDLQAKLKTVTDAISYLDSERSEIEAHKGELQEQLRAAREDNDAAMAEYRENRKLSLALRDLVDAGEVGAAAQQAAQQVETYMAKLAADAAYRKEYLTLWCQQRKYLVSELLPQSGVVAAPAAPPPAKGGAKAPGPAVPQGAAMAQAAIAAALEAADAELAAVRRAAPAPVRAATPSSEEEEVEAEAPSAAAPAADKQQRRIVPGAPDELLFVPKTRQHKPADPLAAAAALVAPAVEYEYLPPVYDKDGKQEVLSAAEQKERIREEQKRKAAEAEERKRKRMDAAAKKRVKAEEAARRTEAEAAARSARSHADAAAAAAAAAEAAAQAARDAAPSGTDGEGEGDVSAIITHATTSARGGGGGSAAAAGSKAGTSRRPPRVTKPAAKKPAITEDPVKWARAHPQYVALGAFAIVMLLLAVLAVR